MSALIVIAKEPIPGRVKTRLVPPLTYDDAAAIAAASLRDTLSNLVDHPAGQRLLAFEGNPDDWRPAGWQAVRQPEGGLDIRLAAAFASVGGGPAVLVGMDTPQLRPEQLTVFDPTNFDACLGLATDGGYWAIGFADATCAERAIVGVTMSSTETGSDQLRRMRELGLRVQLLDVLTDVDDIATAEQVASLVPGSRFADAVAGCEVRV